MSHCLSNLSISHPISSQTALFPHNPSPFQSRSSLFLRTPISGRNRAKNVVRAVAAEGRDNLDHLQRPTKQQPRKRSAPAAPTGLWDRFPTARTVQQMMETMERMMEDPFAYSGGWPSPLPPADSVGYSRGRTPWEIKEAETEYKMRFDMPGMTKEDVKVWVEEKMLVVKAEKSPQIGSENEEENGEDWSPKSYGRYSSRIALPENVQFEKIKAEVKDGVLYISIPKASSSAKIFDINVE
ncbi:Small heat shock protein, chloroplastic [Sesamum angolense]|uniref:Small heat shock protein, chloroplastic n=1 Tax=Sesamum angolense TaxID=2727404 RepID=A0AAE1WU11_9LAMI|nr:Small heat shock protein, chloroplastic [Sesamum angolense]